MRNSFWSFQKVLTPPEGSDYYSWCYRQWQTTFELVTAPGNPNNYDLVSLPFPDWTPKCLVLVSLKANTLFARLDSLTNTRGSIFDLFYYNLLEVDNLEMWRSGTPNICKTIGNGVCESLHCSGSFSFLKVSNKFFNLTYSQEVHIFRHDVFWA